MCILVPARTDSGANCSSQAGPFYQQHCQWAAEPPVIKLRWTLGYLPPMHLRLPHYDYDELRKPSTATQNDDELRFDDLDDEPLDELKLEADLSSDSSASLNICSAMKRTPSVPMLHTEDTPLFQPQSTSWPTTHDRGMFAQAVSAHNASSAAAPALQALNDGIRAYCEFRNLNLSQHEGSTNIVTGNLAVAPGILLPQVDESRKRMRSSRSFHHLDKQFQAELCLEESCQTRKSRNSA